MTMLHEVLRQTLIARGFLAAAETVEEADAPHALACWERPSLGLCDWPRIQDNAFLEWLTPQERDAEIARRRALRAEAEAA